MKTYYKRSAYLFFFLISFSASAQTPPIWISDSLQHILDHSLPATYSHPGAVIEIFVPGKWTWNSATGSAIGGTTTGQTQTTAVPTDRFRVGSITKMMMSTCILKLQEQGLLSIEDSIGTYLRPTLVNDTIASTGVVKIRDLMNHTSGIANSGTNTACQMNVLTNPCSPHTLEESIYCGASQGQLFPPETSWTYSNTNYSILAMILQHVTGMTWSDYLTQTIITPLNLQHTGIPGACDIPEAHMGCYWPMNGSIVDLTIVDASTYRGWADVASTTSDLIIFMQALRSGQIIADSSFALMQTLYPGANQYGLGYDFYTYSGVQYRGHYGEVANTSALFFANTTSTMAPNGYYISYNFNTQGADDINTLALPVFHLLNGNGLAGLEELHTSGNTVQVVPNPATNQFTVQFKQNQEEMVTLQLTDEVGKVVWSGQHNGSTQLPVDCSSLKRGVYTLVISGQHGVSCQRILLN